VTAPRTSNAEAALEVEDLEVRYHGGPEPAVRDVSLRLEPGEGLMVSGRAGAGKTSLVRALLGLVAHRGLVHLLGEPAGAPATRARIGYGPQGERFATELRVSETVRAATALRGLPDPAAATRDAIARAGLQFVGDWRTSRLDAEGFRRLSLAVGIAGDPDLVVLYDPWVLGETLREIRAARARGAAVLVAAERPAGLGPVLGRRFVLADGRPR
jgi:ABC-2 type transport system ATP-binding protein